MSIFMATTKIPVEQTTAEISAMLVKAGARRVVTEARDGEVIGISFSIEVDGREVPFMLPARWEPLQKLLKETADRPSRATEEHAKKVAWRQILRWVQAQLALIQVDMVEIQEVFLPYVVLNLSAGETLYDRVRSSGFKAIGWEGSK